MINFNVKIPNDFGQQLKRELESKLKEHLRRDGINNVSVRIDSSGRAVFDGSDEDLKRVEKSLAKWR